MPNENKILECYSYFKNNGTLDRDVIINKDNVLIDGYVGYLVLKMFGNENIKVLIYD